MTPDESKNEQLLISELADRAGVSVRTIRYYIDQGLLPSPQVRGRYSVYDEDYLDRLKLIRRLKDAYLPLHQIRARLEALSHAEVRQLLEQDEIDKDDTLQRDELPPLPSPEADASSALDYIANLLQTHSNLKPAAAQPKAAAPKSRSAPAVAAASLPAFASPAPAAPPARPVEETTWKRVGLAPNIELHYQEPAQPEERARIEHLIQFARNLFSNQARKP